MQKPLVNLALKSLIFFTFLLNGYPTVRSQQFFGKNTIPSETLWVDSVLNSLSLEERIAQLFLVRANLPNKDYFKKVTNYIKQYNIGGVTFFGSTPYKQALQTNYWQSLAKTPLFISIDAEWGLSMRLDSILAFPLQITLGAIKDNHLIKEMGQAIGLQCREIGIQINFAPVVDINNNAANPVINSRSFGEDRENVYLKGLSYMQGLKAADIIATAKHFPGHGDTDTDSHHSLPIITHKINRLDSIEFYPFKRLIQDSLDAIMIAHLYVPAYEKSDKTSSTLSKNIVQELLRDSLNFEGLIITDALDMKGVTKYHPPGKIELKALLAGNDILLLPQDLPKAIREIKNAVKQGIISTDLIDERCRKILNFKYKCGLYQLDSLNLKNLTTRLNPPENEYLIQRLYKNSITLVKNDRSLIPIQCLDTLRIASLCIGEKRIIPFQKELGKYASVTHFFINKSVDLKEMNQIIDQIKDFNLIIISLNNTNILSHKKFGITQEALNLIRDIAREKTVILDVFANPYSLAFLDSAKHIEAIVMSYQDKPGAQTASAQLIFGGIGARGTLPVTATEEFNAGLGISTRPTRMEYTHPLEFDITADEIEKIDSIARSGLIEEAYPGCQIIAAKNGKIFYNKTFGHHTYKQSTPVEPHHLYDLASITKIAATTFAIMKLYQQGNIDIDLTLQEYLPYLRNTKKGKIVIRELMAHQAGLQAWIPYYRFTLSDSGNPDSLTFSPLITEDFPVRIAENFYIKKDYAFDIFDSIIYSQPRDDHSYKYSDLGFILLSDVIENITNQPFEEYVAENFFRPMGLSSMTFQPRKKHVLSEIVPTEEDQIFRKQLIHGDVHDPGAAMLGGIAGHAGLFANANDLTKLLFMLLNGGYYGNVHYLDTLVISEFTQCQFPLNLNRRGLGFDKPLLDTAEEGPSCLSASSHSYGHSGFTGTYFWVDPDEDLIYVFLSNRVNPSAENTKILELNIRTNLHQAIYDALKTN